MSYNINIPVITDPILQSQPQIKSNFQNINQAFADNHEALTSNTEFSGMHNVLTLRPQGSDPTTAADQVALYNKLVTGIPQLFYMANNAQTPIQLTYPTLTNTGTKQYSFMAGPFIFYAGFISTPADNQLVTLTPGSTLIFVDLIAANSGRKNGLSTIAATNLSGTSFNIRYQTIGVTGSGFDAYYVGIGLP